MDSKSRGIKSICCNKACRKHLRYHQRFCATCRDEVAGCSERAYPSLKVADAQRLLLIQSDQEASSFAAEVRRACRF